MLKLNNKKMRTNGKYVQSPAIKTPERRQMALL